MSETTTRQAVAQGFGTALRQIRDELGLSQKSIHEQSGIPLPMLSGYENGRQRPHEKTLNKLIVALRNLRVPEDRLDNLKAVWEGKSTAPSPESPLPASPPTAPVAPVASGAEATATPMPRPAPLGITIRDAENGGWILTAVIPATFSETRLGEISASVRAVLARLVGS